MIWQPYARVSERGSTWHAQGIDSSVRDQLDACTDYIRRHDPDAEILPPIVDEYERGRDLERPGMQRITAGLQAHNPSGIALE